MELIWTKLKAEAGSFHKVSVVSMLQITFTRCTLFSIESRGSKGNGFHSTSGRTKRTLSSSLSLFLRHLSTAIIREDIEKKRRKKEKKYSRSYNRAKSSNPSFKEDFVEKLKAPPAPFPLILPLSGTQASYCLTPDTNKLSLEERASHNNDRIRIMKSSWEIGWRFFLSKI